MKKKFLKITGIVVLVIALGGFWGYTKYFKPNPEIQQQLDNQFGADFFTSFDEKAVNNVKPVEDLNKTDIPAVESNPEKVKDQAGNQIETNSTPVNETSAGQQITQDEIYGKYKAQFNHLQGVALSRLDILYSAAIQDYTQHSKDGTLNRAQLAQKYIQAGNMLEANVDSQFFSTLNTMQAELIANNLPTDIVGATKSAYEKAKSSKRSQLLAKVSK